jgi:hypothetical protein
VKVLAARWLGFATACLLCAGTLALAGGPPGPPDAASLSVETAAEQTDGDQVELVVSWRWRPPAVGSPWRWRAREELLAVSFDTRKLVVVQEEAPLGSGARGETLRRLEEVAGPDGARRLFVIPEGQNGYVRVRFRSAYPDRPPRGDPFHVYVVFDPPSAPVLQKVLPVGAGPDSGGRTTGLLEL